MTEMERANIENDIAIYQQLLRNNDYRCMKYAEGALTAEEFEPTKQNRAAWRAKINELQAQLAEE